MRGSVAVGVMALLVSACADSTATTAAGSAAEDRAERVRQLARQAPADLLDQARSASGRTAVRAHITRQVPGRDDERSTFLARGDAWRTVTPAPDGGEATLLAVGDTLCFDRGFRPSVTAQVAETDGRVEFDPAAWTCSQSDFGLNPMLTVGVRAQDPRPHLETLTTDGSRPVTVEVVDGEPAVRLSADGVTEFGPLDPQRPRYDLWIDADGLPVRMETDDLTWELDHPGDLDGLLEAPPRRERGSYGWSHGYAKACAHGSQCPEVAGRRLVLSWGDGRR